MNSLLAGLALIICLGVIMVTPDHSGAAAALVVCAVISIPATFIIFRIKTENQFLFQLFIGALLTRIVVGTIINVFELQEFFGGDAYTYDFYGSALLKAFAGDQYYSGMVQRFQGQLGSGAVGMIYMVAAVYKIIGRNLLAVQFVNAV